MNSRLVYEDVLEYIRRCGSDNLSVFGGLFEGGYHIQQVPEELAQAIMILERYRTHTYLEIGAAAGGTARTLKDLGIAHEIFVIDDNKHPKHWVRKFILPCTEWIGDSHSEECRAQLERWGRQFDLVLIDGDHNYEGVRSDLNLVLPFMAPWSILMLHDTVCTDGPKLLREEIRSGAYRGLTEIAHCGDRLGLTLFLYSAD